jgi:GGDEF domain-containing protein
MNLNRRQEPDTSAVLLVGLESPESFADFQDNSFSFVRRNTIAEAIVTLRNNPFDKVVVTLPSLKNHFEPSLKALRQVAGQAQIILLAQMLEEPLLIEHLNRNRASLRLFDDYLISPMRFEEIAKAFRQAAASTEEQMSESEKDRRIEELEKLVIQDDLTGLKNRRYLYHFLPQILALAEREQLRVTLLLFDIDDFKHYNDAYGHAVGDNVLRQTARMIQRCCRSHDVVARLGGDEFAVVFWDLPAEKPELSDNPSSEHDRRSAKLDHPRQPLFMAERFCKELQQAAFEYLGPKGKGALTISGGLATYPADAKTAEELLEKADMAMLEAKRSGKNRIYLVGQPNSE